MTDLRYSPDLLLAMDSLWFQQVVLFSEPKPNSTTTPQAISQTPPPTLQEEQISSSSDTSSLPPQEDSLGDDIEACEDEDEDEDEDIDYSHMRKRHSSLNHAPSITWSPSSSPVLLKTMSCKTFFELECEEVKGFMDLGFRFDKKNVSPRMMSMIPGLQRLDEYKDGVDVMNENDQDGTRRPYLSEAWLIRRPDSPLINLRIPRVSTTDDMKKHLKSWAKTVASTVQVGY